MTGESEGQTAPWIKKHGVQFDYAIDKARKLQAQIGTGGLPNAVLIDPQGKIVWKGHPSRLKEATVVSALGETALARPLYAMPGYTKAVRGALSSGDYKKLYSNIKKIKEAADREEVSQAVDLIIEGRVRGVEELFAAGDYLAVKTLATPMAKSLKGMAQEERLKALVKGLKDKEVVRVIQAQEKIRKLVPEGESFSGKELVRISKQLKRVIEDLPGTQAARDAERALKRLGA